MSELDKLKVNHRSESVRQKTEQLIRRIKEYRRRGPLRSGVPIVKGRVTLSAEPIEPNMDRSLPWLDPNSTDDRILASVIEVMRNSPGSPVALVTRDINLQNKAEFAAVPVLEPPEPTEPKAGKLGRDAKPR